MSAVKSAVVAIQINVTDELPANFTDPKKQIQCKATIAPMTIYCHKYFFGILLSDFPKLIRKNKLIDVNKTRHQTIEIAGMEINLSFPKIAVKPKNRTAI